MFIDDDDIYIFKISMTNIHYSPNCNRIERERGRGESGKKKKKFMCFGCMCVCVCSFSFLGMKRI